MLSGKVQNMSKGIGFFENSLDIRAFKVCELTNLFENSKYCESVSTKVWEDVKESQK
ncbi:hypothetical protein BDW_00275 [Bdellovibrio bacteriovorus W]|nr:hypothetical protein BDW_00275 [Bdellovibrio bacteriovorus W]